MAVQAQQAAVAVEGSGPTQAEEAVVRRLEAEQLIQQHTGLAPASGTAAGAGAAAGAAAAAEAAGQVGPAAAGVAAGAGGLGAAELGVEEVLAGLQEQGQT